MEGGGTESFVLGDIGDYKNVDDMVSVAAASLVGLDAVIAVARFGSVGGFSLNSYFDTFGLEGILSNTTYLAILFQINRWLYSTFYATGERGWSPFVFICMLIALQAINDIIAYNSVLQISSGRNDMVDSLKKYAAENGSRALTSHAVFLIFVGVIAMFLKESSSLFTAIVVIISLYLLPLLLTTVGPRPPPPPPPPEKKGSVESRWNGPMF